MSLGEGRGNPSEEGLPSPLPQTPSSFPSKTFDFIESLLAAFPDDEGDEERFS